MMSRQPDVKPAAFWPTMGQIEAANRSTLSYWYVILPVATNEQQSKIIAAITGRLQKEFRAPGNKVT